LQRERRLTDLTGLDGCGRATHAHTGRPKEQREPVTSQRPAGGQPAPATPPWPATPAATARLQSLASGGLQRAAERAERGTQWLHTRRIARQTPDARRVPVAWRPRECAGNAAISNMSSASRRSILPDDALTGLD
jgi:hypothetical protein